MRIVLLGPPGAGKGTQSEFISRYLHIPVISTGEMLRQSIRSGSATGQQIQAIMRQGELVSDTLMIAAVMQRIAEPDCQKGFLLDGFPRNIIQAEALVAEHIVIDFVIEINVDDDEIVKRLSGRRFHPASGRTYHIEYHPPKVDNLDDITHEPLVQREDDQATVVRQRLMIYRQQTQPLIDYYQHKKIPFSKISGTGKIDQIHENIKKVISTHTGVHPC